MDTLSTFRYFIVLSLFYLYLRTALCEVQDLSTFTFENFGKDSKFESQIALYGDAKVVNGGSSVQMSGSVGRIMKKKPIKLVERNPNPRRMVSFNVHFAFSLSRENGDGFAFVMVPFGFPFDVFDGGLFGKRKMKFLAVEFDTFMNKKKRGDVRSFVSVKVSNISTVKSGIKLNSGEKLQCWIDYEASSKRLEVRLSKIGGIRPVNPVLSRPIDMSRMWKEDELYVGLSASTGNSNSTQKCNIYSWSFSPRTAPHWMHSEPLDPQTYVGKKQELMKVHSKSDCALRILGALLFGTGCGALGALIVVIIWTVVGSKRPVAPEVPAVEEHKEYDEYKKFKVVVVDKAASIEDGKSKNLGL